MLAIVLFLILLISLFTIFATMAIYIGVGVVLLVIFSFVYSILVYYLGKWTNDKIFIFLNRKTIIATIVIAVLCFLVWYYVPRMPIDINKEDVAYYTIDPYINAGKSNIDTSYAIEKTLEFLNSKKLHRTIKHFTDKDTSGFVITFYNNNDEVIETIQMVHGEVVKINDQYYKTYSIKKEYFEIKDLQSIINSEYSIKFKESNTEAFNKLKESARYENGKLYFVMPTFTRPGVTIDKIKGTIDFINGGATKKTLYFLEDYLVDHGYKPGDTVEIPIDEQVAGHKFYDFKITFDFDNIKCSVDFTDMLSEKIRHDT